MFCLIVTWLQLLSWTIKHKEIIFFSHFLIHTTLVIAKSKGRSEKLRDIRTSTYHICRHEENVNRTTTFHKWICNLTPEDRDILKILWKRGEIAPKEQFLLFSTIFCYMSLDFYAKTGTRFSLPDKRLVEISEVEITRVDCISFYDNDKFQNSANTMSLPLIIICVFTKSTVLTLLLLNKTCPI